MSVAVCTIARGRRHHLDVMMRALAAQHTRPDLFVIGVMQDEPYSDLPPLPFPVRQVLVPGEPAPLAAARNACAARADTDTVVFLDVDCIAAPGLVTAFCEAVRAGRCVFGDTRYLTQGAARPQAEFDFLWQNAVEHPARKFRDAFGQGVHRIADMSEFWSLSFAMTVRDFRASGGFDERFRGYGGEDTDFAMAMAEAGIELYWASDAQAVHQWHPVHIPPLGHLDPIVDNANLFYRTHGRWCMDYWLKQLADAGFIAWEQDRVTILRRPSADEFEAAVQDGSVAFS